MGHIVRFVLLIALALPLQAQPTISPGQLLPDFSLPAVNGFGQRLAEQRGQAVMLIWLGDCDACHEQLAAYQLLAEGRVNEGLVSWFVWTPAAGQQPPNMRLPVLISQPRWRTGWAFEPRPAVMLINADGVLDHLILGDLDDNYSRVEQRLSRWLTKNNQ